MNLNKKNYRGFTFVEVIMVIAISGILMTISIISFDAIRKNAMVNAAMEETDSALKMAKGFALQGKMPGTGGSCNNKTICGYGFVFNNASEYEVFYYYHCDGGGKLDCTGSPAAFTRVTVDKQNLKNHTALVSPTPANSSVFFNIPWGDMGVATARTYDVGFTGRTKQVNVTAFGSIQHN